MNDIERLFKAHYAQLHRLAVALLHDDDAARDIVHDVFESLLNANSSASVGPGYLVQAVRNRCMNHLRDIDRHSRIARLHFMESEEYDSEDWPDEETIERINSIIRSGLTDQCRRVMELRFIKGMPFTEIAKETGVSETTVYKHVRQALITIRKNLNENG